MKRCHMLDFLKGISCMLVVFIHVVFPGILGEMIKLLSAYAVPFFYMVTGYFAFGKNSGVIKRRLIKIIYITVFSYIIFFLDGVFGAMRQERLDVWLIENFTLEEISRYFLFCTIGFAIPLWYLLAQIETYILWFVTVKLKIEKLFIALMPVLFLAQVCIVTYCDTYNIRWFYKVNFLTRALPWFVFGYYIHSIPREKFDKINDCFLGFSMAVGMIITCLPTLFNYSVKFNSVGYIPYSLALFIFAIKYADIDLSSKMEYIGRELSLWVYIFHLPVANLMDYFAKHWIQIDITTDVYGWFRPVATLCIVLVLAYTINVVQKKNKDYDGNRCVRVS